MKDLKEINKRIKKIEGRLSKIELEIAVRERIFQLLRMILFNGKFLFLIIVLFLSVDLDKFLKILYNLK